MKTIVALFIVFSSLTAFASENGVLNAMKSIFREGNFAGLTPHNSECLVSFKFHADRVEIFATTGLTKVYRTVFDGTGYRFNVGTRHLLSSDQAGTFRSLAVDQDRTYVVVAESIANSRERKVECILNLNQ